MVEKPTYEELEQRVKELEKESFERKKAEKALRESEVRYRSLFESSIDSIYITEKDGTFVNANQSFFDLFGYTKNEMKNLRAQDLYLNYDDRQMFLRELEQKGFARDYLMKLSKKDGTEMSCLMNATVRQADDGSILGHQGIIRDITEIKQTEETLRQSEATARAMLNVPTEIMLLADLDGTIIDINESGAENFERSRNELIGICVFDLFPPDVSERRKLMVEKVIKSRKPIHFVDERNGRWFNQQFYPVLDLQEEVARLAVYVQDITDMKQSEEALRNRERELENKTKNLEEVNTALKVLLKKREEDKIEIEEKILLNVKELVEPYLEKLKNSELDERQMTFADIVESNLNDIISPFMSRLSSKYLKLTPTEIQIANLVRQGRRTKEIAGLLNLSARTIKFHRENIRKKIGIKNHKANLRSRLLSLQ